MSTLLIRRLFAIARPDGSLGGIQINQVFLDEAGLLGSKAHIVSETRPTVLGAPVADRQAPRRCLASVVGITINLIRGEYTASSRLIPSRVTWFQANVCFSGNYFRFTSSFGHSRGRH